MVEPPPVGRVLRDLWAKPSFRHLSFDVQRRLPGASITATYALVTIRERALASALLLFVINLIGLGVGPLFAGFASDQLRRVFVERGPSETEALGAGLRRSWMNLLDNEPQRSYDVYTL